MALSPSAPKGAVVIDSNVLIAMAAHEIATDVAATAAIAGYVSHSFALYTPGVAIAETLYILCGKVKSGILTPAEYSTATCVFARTVASIEAPPNGDKALITRAVQIAGGYGCSRSADSLYIALAEELSQTIPTVLLTLDRDLPRQATKNAPTVKVHLL